MQRHLILQVLQFQGHFSCQETLNFHSKRKNCQGKDEVQFIWKAEFTFIAQIFVGVTDATAHVDYITSEVNKIWGQGHDLVTNDGLPIVDCSGTQGIYFCSLIMSC